MLNTVHMDAIALLDGGWKPEDRDEIKAEFELTDDEADDICAEMENILNGRIDDDIADILYREARESGEFDYIFG